MKTFLTVHRNIAGAIHTEPVDGEIIFLHDIPLFIFYDVLCNVWNISHLETGMKIKTAWKREDVIKEADKALSTDKVEEVIEKGRRIIIDYGLKLPLNAMHRFKVKTA